MDRAPPRRRPAALRALLRDLGPQLRLGGAPAEPPARLATGLPEIDRLLGGGFPRARLSEITGPPSSGRTSLALALMAQVTRSGEPLALVDGADAFDPASAEVAGVRLERVLWVRAPSEREALHSAARLLAVEGFPLVLLDRAPAPQAPARATWTRLARTAAATGTALIVLSPARSTDTCAELVLEMRPARARFGGMPTLLEGLEIEAELVRHRRLPQRRTARLCLSA